MMKILQASRLSIYILYIMINYTHIFAISLYIQYFLFRNIRRSIVAINEVNALIEQGAGVNLVKAQMGPEKNIFEETLKIKDQIMYGR